MLKKIISMTRFILVVALLWSVGLPGTAQAADREITLINVKYMGKIIWLPGTVVVKKGETVKFTLINNVQDDPNVHGFYIPEYDVKEGVERGTPKVVEFKAKKTGLFEIQCHIHPAHLHSQLLVIDK